MRTYPKLLRTDGKLAAKFGVSAPKFVVNFQIVFCRYMWYFSTQSHETKCKLITTQKLLNSDTLVLMLNWPFKRMK